MSIHTVRNQMKQIKLNDIKTSKGERYMQLFDLSIPKILVTTKKSSIALFPSLFDGFDIIYNYEPKDIFSMISSHRPDLIIMDADMEPVSGYEILKSLKRFYKTERIPVVLTAGLHEDVEPCLALELGAIDFIIKPISQHLLRAKVNNYIQIYHSLMMLEEQAKYAKEMNPNTELPGNTAISTSVYKALNQKEEVVMVYADLDNFKSYNDKYGFGRGDEIIKFTARIIKETLSEIKGYSFLGHIGGDDFVYIVPKDIVEQVADTIILKFDEGIREFYTVEDRKRDYIISTTRQGEVQKFPIMTISMAGVDLSYHPSSSRYEEIADICAEVKKYAKQFSHSCFFIDRRYLSEKNEYMKMAL